MTTDFYFLALGSNLGDRQANIDKAVELLGEKFKIIARSSVIETEPQGFTSPHRFLNAVVEVCTSRSAHEVLAITQQIEQQMGRTTKSHDGHYADRIIDIDLLGDPGCSFTNVIYTHDLRLPHPRMWQRDFVLRPFAEIRPKRADATPRVATIGYFDGVHIGHQHLMDQVSALAAPTGRKPLLITFDRHPRSVVGPSPAPVPALVIKLVRRKWEYQNHVDVAQLEFGPEMAALTAREFMHKVLRQQLNVGTLVIGHDHHFGRPTGQPEGFEDYRRYGAEVGIDVRLATELITPLGHVSSSAIRRALAAGDIRTANAMLGRTYFWDGTVVHGQELGRRLGFPTANLKAFNPELMLPGNGVYAAWVYVPGKSELSIFGSNPPPPGAHVITPKDGEHIFAAYTVGGHRGPFNGYFRAMVNIGTRPTVADSGEVTVEVHLLDFDADIYGLTIHLYFIERMRPEQHFDDLQALVRALEDDRRRLADILIPPPDIIH